MNKLIVAIMASVAVSAFAAEPVALKTTPNPVVAPTPDVKAPAHKKADKPVKSAPAKDEKAAVPATKPASK